jgi:hypothetical protein
LKVLKLLGVDVSIEEKEQQQKIASDPRNDDDKKEQQSQTPRRRSRTDSPEASSTRSIQNQDAPKKIQEDRPKRP